MKKHALIVLLSGAIIAASSAYADDQMPSQGEPPPFNYVPPNGVIPDEATAVQVAEAILKPIYGEKEIKTEEPFTATLGKDVWTVKGHFSGDKDTLGGVAVIGLSKSKGTVLLISHGM